VAAKSILCVGIYLLRLIQLISIAMMLHFGRGIIGNLATGKLVQNMFGVGLALLVLVLSSIALTCLKARYPDTVTLSLTSADRHLATPLKKSTQTIFWVLVIGFCLAVVGYMMVCMF
jgi:hypothetical protein